MINLHNQSPNRSTLVLFYHWSLSQKLKLKIGERFVVLVRFWLGCDSFFKSGMHLWDEWIHSFSFEWIHSQILHYGIVAGLKLYLLKPIVYSSYLFLTLAALVYFRLMHTILASRLQSRRANHATLRRRMLTFFPGKKTRKLEWIYLPGTFILEVSV